RQDAESREDREAAEARVEAAQAAARHLLLLLQRAPDLGAGERGHREEQIKREEKEEVQVGGEDRGGQQFQKGDGGREEEVAVRTRAQDLHHRQKEDQVDGGVEKCAREEEVIER